MKRAHASLLVLALAASALAPIACAGSDNEVEPQPPSSDHDAAIPTVTADASDVTEPPEASASDAAARTCSIHGFCHTALPGDFLLEGVWGDGSGVVWAVSAEGNVLRWDGKAWKVHVSNLGPLRAIWGSGATDLWVGGETGLYHGTGASSDALTFAASALPGDTASITSIWGSSASDVWAIRRIDIDGADPGGEVLHFSAADGGESWEIDPVSERGVAFSNVWGSASSGVWVAGSRPIPDQWANELAVFRKTTGDFTEVTLPIDSTGDPVFGRIGQLQTAIYPDPSTLLLFSHTVMGAPSIWKGTSSDDGQTFTWTYALDGNFGDPTCNGAYGSAPNDVWAAGDYGRVRHWNGTSWSPAAITVTDLPVIDPLHAVWGHGASDLWIVGDHIALHYDPTQKTSGGVP
jgi:hypothetical protein